MRGVTPGNREVASTGPADGLSAPLLHGSPPNDVHHDEAVAERLGAGEVHRIVPAARNRASSLAKAFSIGSKSGL